jgi:hypothetical protein
MKNVVLSLLLVGCGSDGGGGEPLEIDDFGLEFATVSCGIQFECCTDAEIMAQYMGITHDGHPITTEQDCIAFGNAILTGLAVQSFKDSIALGRAEYDADAAGDCLAALSGLSCAEYNMGENAIASSDCRPYLLPKVGDGGACTQDFECTSNNCFGEKTSLGEPSEDGTCQPLPTAGQGCDDSCADGLFCGTPPTSGTEICQPLKSNGSQCNLDRECSSDNCDQASDMCAAKPATCDGR